MTPHLSRRTFLHGSAATTAGALALGVLGASPAAAQGARRNSDRLPMVEGPISGGTHGRPFWSYYGDLGRLGYVEEEYFLSGIATSYQPAGSGLTPDGRWSLEPRSTSEYKTRMLVRYPEDPNRFNGTVIVEWVNVSSGHEISFSDGPGLYEAGFAFAIVSAQRAGLFGNVYETDPVGLTQWDTQRYGSLTIEDDSYSYDIYTQAARALLGQVRPGRAQPPVLGQLRARKLIAVGGSQSGTRLLAYSNGVQPIENLFDALLPIVCAGTAADFDPEPAHPDPNGHSRSVPALARTDQLVPVLEINSETEALYYYATGRRQPDTRWFREWEVAGATHANVPITTGIAAIAHRDGVQDWGQSPTHASDVDWLPTLDAAYRHVQRWVHGGPPPPAFPKMQIDTTGAAPDYVRDGDGNVAGGIRLPELTVPVAAYSGALNLGLGGSTTPFTADRLATLYPAHADYYTKVLAAAQAAEDQGVILPYRRWEYVGAALTAPVPPY